MEIDKSKTAREVDVASERGLCFSTGRSSDVNAEGLGGVRF